MMKTQDIDSGRGTALDFERKDGAELDATIDARVIR